MRGVSSAGATAGRSVTTSVGGVSGPTRPPPLAWAGRLARRPAPPALLPSPPAAGFRGFGKAKPKKATPGEPVWVTDRAACPCGSGAPFAACCSPPIEGSAPAPTPEALMRSRFSAYVKGRPIDADYIMATTHPANPASEGSARPDGTPASTFQEDVRATIARVAWQGLTILPPPEADKVGPGGVTLADPDKGVVRFRATYKVTGQAGYRPDGGGAVGVMDETSVFVREGGRWLYLGGDVELNGGVR